MLITTRQRRSLDEECTDLDLVINGESVPVCESQKLLGVTVSQSLDWNEHVKNVSKSINYRLYILAKIRHFLRVNARIAYCNGYISPYLD